MLVDASGVGGYCSDDVGWMGELCIGYEVIASL